MLGLETEHCLQRCAALHVLVVEDDPDMADSTMVLLNLHGHDATICRTGTAAVLAAELHRPDVVLLDLGLPGSMDGWQVARQLCGLSGEKRPLIIAVSGYADEEARRRSREAGIDVHLAKPFEPAALFKFLERFVAVLSGATERATI